MNEWLTKMERKYGRFAIANLMNYMIALYVAGYLCILIGGNGYIFYHYLSWDVNAILHGQVWRLVTFLLNPPSYSIFGLLISCFCYWMIGNNLERVWGIFRFNVYMLTGILGQIIGGFLAYFLFHINVDLGTSYLNWSLFLALAMTFPDMQFYLYFLLPVKAKWLAYVDLAFLAVEFVIGDWGTRIQIFFSLVNFFIYLAMIRQWSRFSPKNVKRRKEFKQAAASKKMRPSHHKCAICGRTEADGSDLEFRYCSKCEGTYEYCQDHLYTHVHVKADGSHLTH